MSLRTVKEAAARGESSLLSKLCRAMNVSIFLLVAVAGWRASVCFARSGVSNGAEGAPALREVLQQAARQLKASASGGGQIALLTQKGGAVLDGYVSTMLGFFLQESGLKVKTGQAEEPAANEGGASPERISFSQAGEAGEAVMCRLLGERGAYRLAIATYSLKDGRRTGLLRLEFRLSEDLMPLETAQRRELPAPEQEWRGLFDKVFPPCRVVADVGKRYALAEGEYFFESGLWDEAASRLLEGSSQRPDRCLVRIVMSLQLAAKGPRALAHLDETLKQYPDSGPLYALKGWLTLRLGEVHDALVLLEEARVLDIPREGYYWLARHLVALESGEKQVAEQAVLKAVGLLPGEPMAQLWAARFYWKEANLARAQEFYQRAIAAGAANADTWMELGITLDAAGQAEQALDALRRALELEPGNPSVSRQLSFLLRSLERREEALEVLRKAAQARPDRIELLAAYADAAAEMWKVVIAQQAYAETLKRDPQFHYGKVGLAEMLARQRQYAEAERLLREVIESASEYQPARLALGRLLAEQGRIGEAEQTLLFAAKDPRYEAPARLALARVLSHGGEHARAIRNAQIAVASRPDAEGLAVLALAFVGTAQWENADLAVHRALEADPRACSAYLATAQLAKARGQNEQALAAAEQAVKLSPYSVEALALAGRLCLDLDRPKQCVEFWAKAVKLNSWDVQLHWDLADLYRLRLNERASAIGHYRRYIELKGPKAKEAQELIDKLQAAASPG